MSAIKTFQEMKVTGRLPSPSGVGMAILKITQRDDYAIQDLVKLVASDPALTGRLIKMANSARTAGLSPFTTVEDAALRLGARTVRNVALSFSLVSGHRIGHCREFDYDRFWARSLATAVACQWLMTKSRLVAPAEGFVLGLLADVGTLALASVHSDAYGELLTQTKRDPSLSLREEERRLFAIDHAEVTSELHEEWELPASFGKAAASFESCSKTQFSWRSLKAHLWLARTVAEAWVTGGKPRPRDSEELETLRSLLELEREELEEILLALYEEWKEWGHVLEIPTADLPAMAGMVIAEVLKMMESAPPVSCSVAARGLRILAVDDDRVSLTALVNTLRQAGHDVSTAADGKAGLRVAMEINPHVVVTDWQMPQMDGVEFCRALRRFEAGREMYVILLTGREDDDLVVSAFDAGADDYVTKPFNPKVLQARVRAGERVARLQSKIARDQQKMQEQVAELGILARRLKLASLTDPLTGLRNRRFAMDKLEQLGASVERGEGPICAILVDVDHFKRVNDQFGHAAGDEVLREVAGILAAGVGGSGCVCRIGGEEFLILAEGLSLKESGTLAEDLRRRVEEHWSEARRSVTISVGVAEWTAETGGPDALLQRADELMYEGKTQGRNRVVVEGRVPPRQSSVSHVPRSRLDVAGTGLPSPRA